jgi:hypothetical protein
MEQNLQQKLTQFVAGVQELLNKEYLTHPASTPRISFSEGKKYIRVIRQRPCVYGVFEDESVYCFIDTTNGDVLKAASWKAPAKHKRGNIFDQWNGLRNCSWTGPAYLK